MTKLEAIRGERLEEDVIKLWNKTMNKAFQEENPLNPQDRKSFAKDIFFFIKNKDKIVSMGRLKPVKVNFLDKSYEIYGIADIVSIEEGKGYGKALTKAMKDYLEKSKKTGIGFCLAKNAPFYEKSGFSIRSLIDRFVYINNEKKEIRNEHDEVIFYIDGEDKLIEKVLANQQNIKLPVKHW